MEKTRNGSFVDKDRPYGFNVPGSILIYGSNFWMVTRNPLACNNFAKDAAIIPLPKDDVTPPVTKTYLVFCMIDVGLGKSTNSKLYLKIK